MDERNFMGHDRKWQFHWKAFQYLVTTRNERDRHRVSIQSFLNEAWRQLTDAFTKCAEFGSKAYEQLIMTWGEIGDDPKLWAEKFVPIFDCYGKVDAEPFLLCTIEVMADVLHAIFVYWTQVGTVYSNTPITDSALKLPSSRTQDATARIKSIAMLVAGGLLHKINAVFERRLDQEGVNIVDEMSALESELDPKFVTEFVRIWNRGYMRLPNCTYVLLRGTSLPHAVHDKATRARMLIDDHRMWMSFLPIA
jgi:hypothetical protein